MSSTAISPQSKRGRRTPQAFCTTSQQRSTPSAQSSSTRGCAATPSRPSRAKSARTGSEARKLKAVARSPTVMLTRKTGLSTTASASAKGCSTSRLPSEPASPQPSQLSHESSPSRHVPSSGSGSRRTFCALSARGSSTARALLRPSRPTRSTAS
eukprot:Amastigsp_a515824_6.p2 type:complete len:155 gc:universal Amastigsp_a515824_6:121-585(+)